MGCRVGRLLRKLALRVEKIMASYEVLTDTLLELGLSWQSNL